MARAGAGAGLEIGGGEGVGAASAGGSAGIRAGAGAASRSTGAVTAFEAASARWQAASAEIAAKASQETRVGCQDCMGAREVYQRTKKVPDLFWNRFVCRPLAAVVVDLVKGTRVTPNQITLASFVVGVVSAALLIALPGHVGLVVAVLVYQLSYVLDCADGMLARWRGLASPGGHLLDFLMDELKAFAILAAAAVRLHLEHPTQPFLLLGIAGLVCLASGIALTSFQRHPEIAPPKSTAEPSKSLVARAVRLVESGAKFVIHYPSYILYVALSGHLELYLYLYLAVNALYAAKSWLGVALRFGKS
jgi:phosphatidylglycerophosphate synthase